MITLGIIGVVAAVVLPTVLTNVQERVRNEQVRTVKYKLTLATDKMKSMGLLSEAYPTTEDFVNELKKHFKIAKVCDNRHLRDCWGSDKINRTGTQTPIDVSTLEKGEDIQALGISTKNTRTVGIVTADGTPMILTYSPKCTPLDAEKTYTWSTTSENKPETNATTNCISAIFDINGGRKPNKIGKDVRTLNSLFGYSLLSSYTRLKKDVCEKEKGKLGIKQCKSNNRGAWDGAMKACYDLGLHLPSTQTLANIAGSMYGISNVEPNTYIISTSYIPSEGGTNCDTYYKSQSYQNYLKKYGSVICVNKSSLTIDEQTSIPSEIINVDNIFWTNQESFVPDSTSGDTNVHAYGRNLYNGDGFYSTLFNDLSRQNSYKALCVGD